MLAWLEQKARAIGGGLLRWLARIGGAIGASLVALERRIVAPLRPCAEQMLSADAILFETLALEAPTQDDRLARRLFSARILAHVEFLAERAADPTRHTGAANQGTPILQRLGLEQPFERAAAAHSLAAARRHVVLAAWHACLCQLPVDFEAVAELDRRATQAVLDALAEHRNEQAGGEGIAPRGTTGVALSGGGIRSASFALGVLQELAQRRLLYGVDYLSAVSGGSYIASWLTTWAYRHRAGIRGVEDEFALGGASPAPLRWVRRYGVYLAPHFGVFAPDLWSLGMTYLRNTLPILCITVPLLAGIMALPHIVLSLTPALTELTTPAAPGDRGALAWAVVLVGAPYLVALIALRRYTLYTVGHDTTKLADAIPALMAGFSIVGGWLVATGIAALGNAHAATIEPWMFPAAALLLHVAASFTVPKQVHDDTAARTKPTPRGSLLRLATATVAAGAFSGAGLYVVSRVLANVPDPTLITVGPLLIVLAVGLGEIAFATAMTPVSDDVDRAWWSRAAAYAVMPTIVWMLLCSVAFAPPLAWDLNLDPAALARHYAWWLSGAGIAVLGVIGTLLASARMRARIAAWAPRVALVVVALLMLGAIAWGTNAAFQGLPQGIAVMGRESPDPVVLAVSLTAFFFALAALASIAVNLNRSSLHGLYRDGLIRTFLGASRLSPDNRNLKEPTSPLGVHGAERWQWKPRKAEHFTNIDDNDNPALAWLRPGPRRKLPMLLINASLNGLMPGRRPGREARQYPFTFGPIHCGSPAPGVGYGWTPRFFRASKLDKKLTLGTAMAVSGAAVSPNPGRTGSSVLSFLMTMVNGRIGLWIGNPRYRDTPGQTSPLIGLPYLMSELFAVRRKFSRWIQLSDGGHFENIGLYELIRRRCARIIVVDASCDPGRAFADIGDAIRRIRIDLNVDILATAQWRIGEPDLGATGQEWSMFEIVYPGGTRGRMLYIKPSLYDDSASALPMDVLDYWSRHPEFPHETTANQFFSEAQLEAYRSLGRFCTKRALNAVLEDSGEATWTHWVEATLIARTLAATPAPPTVAPPPPPARARP